MEYELFSTRQKRLRGEISDVYQYEIIPPELRVQIVYIWRDTLKSISFQSYSKTEFGDAHDAYKAIYNELCRAYGRFALDEDSNFYQSESDDSYYQLEGKSYPDSVVEYFLKIDETEMVIDVIEVSFRYIDQVFRDKFREDKSDGLEDKSDELDLIFGIRPHDISPNGISPDEAIDQLNRRFHQHNVGYQYESGQIIRVDSQFIHSEVVKPTLGFLSDPIYRGANEEFLKAHEHYRKGNYKDCITNCLKAFESCLKTICRKRKWYYDDKRAAAKNLIQIVLNNNLIPVFMESHFSGLRGALESGLTTLRNRNAGHGQGPEKVSSPDYIAAYALHLTASNILLLTKADKDIE